MDQEYWREEALYYCPGKMLDIRMCMPGFRLMLQDDKGQYPHSSHALIFEGSMLVYDPQWDIAQWVPIWGTSATLTTSELCTANDLNNMVPSPSSELEPAKPIGTVYRNYHHPTLIITFIFPDLLLKILRTSSQERTCPTWTYACLVKHYSK